MVYGGRDDRQTCHFAQPLRSFVIFPLEPIKEHLYLSLLLQNSTSSFYCAPVVWN